MTFIFACGVVWSEGELGSARERVNDVCTGWMCGADGIKKTGRGRYKIVPWVSTYSDYGREETISLYLLLSYEVLLSQL